MYFLQTSIIGQNIELAVVRPVRSGPPPFSVGDKIQVTVNVEQLKAMQQGHGGWNPRMAEVIGFYYHFQNFFNGIGFSISEKLAQCIG